MNVSGSDSGVCGSEAEHRLFSVIFSSYNQYIRPVENVSEPVVVQFEVSMSQLVKVVSGCGWFILVLRLGQTLVMSLGVFHSSSGAPESLTSLSHA